MKIEDLKKYFYDFLKEYNHYDEFIVKQEIKIKINKLYKGYNELVETYDELIIPFKINGRIIEMNIR